MTRTTKYVAFDVHQATTVSSVREEGGRVLARSILETHGPTIVEFLRGLRGAIHVAFEEGTQEAMARRLRWSRALRRRAAPSDATGR